MLALASVGQPPLLRRWCGNPELPELAPGMNLHHHLGHPPGHTWAPGGQKGWGQGHQLAEAGNSQALLGYPDQRHLYYTHPPVSCFCFFLEEKEAGLLDNIITGILVCELQAIGMWEESLQKVNQ